MFDAASPNNIVVSSPLVVTYEKGAGIFDTTGEVARYRFTRVAQKTYRFVGLTPLAAIIAERERVALYTRQCWMFAAPITDEWDDEKINKTAFALQAEIVRRRNDNGSWDLSISIRERDEQIGKPGDTAASIFAPLERSRDYEENIGAEDSLTISVASSSEAGYKFDFEYPRGISQATVQYKRTESELEWTNAIGSNDEEYDLEPGYLVRAISGFYVSNIITLPAKE